MSLDLLPSSERHNRRRKMRSFEEYAASREKIQSVEQITEQSEHAKKVAEIGFALEMEPKVQESLQKSVNEILPYTSLWQSLNASQQEVVLSKQFTVQVEGDSAKQDIVAIVPEGNVAEKIQLPAAITEQIASQLQQEV